MTELTPPSGNKKIQISQVIIAVLVLVALLQTAALIALHNQQTKMNNRSPSFPTNVVSQMNPQAGVAHFQDPWGADPFEEFDAVSRHMSNMMRQAFMMNAPLMRSSVPSGNFDFSPAVDLEETNNAYIVHGDLPGLDKDKINVTVKNNILTIEGMRQTASETNDQKKGFYSQERSYGSFSRSLNLPGPVDDTKIHATYKNGVLEVTLPKVVNAKDLQKISVQ